MITKNETILCKRILIDMRIELKELSYLQVNPKFAVSLSHTTLTPNIQKSLEKQTGLPDDR